MSVIRTHHVDYTSTLEIAYSQIISAMLDAAQDHINLADSLNSQVVETLKATERRHEEAKRKQMQFFQKLLSERDRAYAERVKVLVSVITDWLGISC